MSAQNPTASRTEVRRYFQDGLFELTFGVAMILILGMMLIPDVPFFMLWYLPWMVVYLMLPQAKRKYSAPRGGVAELPMPNKATLKVKLVLLGLVTLLLGLFAFTLTLRGDPRIAFLHRWIDWGVERFPLVVGLILALMFGALAYRGGISRFMAYAGLAGVTGVAGTLFLQSLRHGTGLVCGLVGIAALVSGVVLYVEFRKNHPVVEGHQES